MWQACVFRVYFSSISPRSFTWRARMRWFSSIAFYQLWDWCNVYFLCSNYSAHHLLLYPLTVQIVVRELKLLTRRRRFLCLFFHSFYMQNVWGIVLKRLTSSHKTWGTWNEYAYSDCLLLMLKFTRYRVKKVKMLSHFILKNHSLPLVVEN